MEQNVILLILFLWVSTLIFAIPIQNGLVAYWQAENNAQDVYGNNGTLQNGATFATGKFGQAFSLQSDAHISIGNPASLKLTNQITISAWINTNNLVDGQIAQIVSKWGQSTALDSYSLSIIKSGGVIRLGCGIGVANSGDSGLSGGTILPNTFVHVAMTYNSSTGSNILYLNGSSVASRTRAGGIFTSDHNILIGREASALTRNFNGLIDEVAIFDRALALSEIQTISQETVPEPATWIAGIAAILFFYCPKKLSSNHFNEKGKI